MSWSQVLAHAVMQKESEGVSDPDRAWILGELIALEHGKSGALEFDDMGRSYTAVERLDRPQARCAVRQGHR